VYYIIVFEKDIKKLSIERIGYIYKIRELRQNYSNRRTILPEIQPDTFEKSASITENERIVNDLFGKGNLELEYKKMTKHLGLIHPPKLYTDMSVLNLSDDYGGGYNFAKNIIAMNPNEYKGKLYKVCIVKDGKEKVMIAPDTKMPVIAQKSELKGIEKKFPGMKIVKREATKEDLKKLFTQKLMHEAIHAQQHELMARTETIGAEKVILNKGIALYKNLTPEQKTRRQEIRENIYKNSCWSKYTDVENTIKRDSSEGVYAFLLSIANEEYTNNPDNPEYYSNLMEREAYERSYQYVTETMGEY
jgi:hypothetical protein